MEEGILIDKFKQIKDIVAISQFGSYGTEFWVKDRSDIDIAVIVTQEISYMDTLSKEDDILPILEEYYNYNRIHLTFILFKEFDNKYAKLAIDSTQQFIINEELWFDFQHYVLKYLRNNEVLQKTLNIDEQYSYFGGIIDESLLKNEGNPTHIRSLDKFEEPNMKFGLSLKKEKFLDKYKSANQTMEDLKYALNKYRKDNDRITKRAIFAYFQDFCEFVVDMCESYIMVNNEKVDSTFSAMKLIEKSYEMGFFDETLKDYLSTSVKLRNRYTHDYYKRESSEKQIEEFCYSKILFLDIFLESSKDNVILKYKENTQN